MPDFPRHFELDVCNGLCGAIVHIQDESDLEYWTAEAKRTNHKMIYRYHVSEDYYNGLYGPAHDVYGIVPMSLEVSHA